MATFIIFLVSFSVTWISYPASNKFLFYVHDQKGNVVVAESFSDPIYWEVLIQNPGEELRSFDTRNLDSIVSNKGKNKGKTIWVAPKYVPPKSLDSIQEELATNKVQRE